MARKRVTYRPSKSGSAFGGIVGIIFILIGLLVAVPTFGLFGILWTAIAVGITIMNFYQAFGKKYVGPEISIEDEAERPAPPPSGGSDVKQRLEQLEELKNAGLLTEEEYRQKRAEILGEL